MMPSVRRSEYKNQVGVLAVVGGEGGCAGGLGDPVVEEPLDLGIGGRVVEDRPQPGDGVET